MTTSNNNHRGLLEAVAAMDVTSTPPIGVKPSAKTDSGGVDSGYASQSSMQSSSRVAFLQPCTPNSSKVAFVAFVKHGSGRPSWHLSSRKTTKLKPFDKPIPQMTQDRFTDLRELHAESLNKLTQSLPSCQGILMRLQVLGESEATAEPWVFVQCDKAVAKKVGAFFKQPLVKLDFEPSHPDSHSPRFRIIVCELPPKQLAKDGRHMSSSDSMVSFDLVEIYGDNHGISSGTLCGTGIKAVTLEKSRMATLGGLIEVTHKEEEHTFFGVTAGHFLTQEKYEEDVASEDRASNDLDDEFSDDEDEFELDVSSLESSTPIEGELLFESFETAAEDEDEDESAWSKIGHVAHVSHESIQDGRNLDWALTTVDNQFVNLPNIITPLAVNALGFTHVTGLGRKVVLSTARGLQTGTLSESWSYLMLAPGSVLVKTYLLTLLDNNVLHPGDSGAWVIDYETNGIYGHAVASDVFGQAYIVPIDDMLEDIKTQLSAKSVSLPFGGDEGTLAPELPEAIGSVMPENEIQFNSSIEISDSPGAFNPFLTLTWHTDMEHTISRSASEDHSNSSHPLHRHPSQYIPDSGYSSFLSSTESSWEGRSSRKHNTDPPEAPKSVPPEVQE